MSQPAATEKPETPLPVEKDWLVQVINEKCAGACGVLKGYQCEIIGEGKGFLSYVTRVTLDWDPKSKGLSLLPKGVIIKKPTLDKIKQMGEMADMITVDKLIEFHNQECKVYEYLNLQSPPPIAMAKHFHLKKAKNADDYGLLVLEDLTEVGVSLKFDESVNIDQVMHLAENVAKLQAYGVNMGRQTEFFAEQTDNPFDSFFDDLEKNLDLTRAEITAKKIPHSNEHYRAMVNNSKSKLQMFSNPKKFGFTPVISLGDVQPNNILWRHSKSDAAVPGNNIAVFIDICGSHSSITYAKFRNSDNPKKFGFTPVISLGDVQPNNILWHRSKSDAAVPGNTIAAFIDFQIAHLGNCMSDIVYTMVMGLPATIRQAKQDAVLDHYLTVLAKETGGKCPITRTEALEVRRLLMQQFAVMGLSMMPMFKQFQKMANIGDEFMMEQFDRMLTLAEEVEAECK